MHTPKYDDPVARDPKTERQLDSFSYKDPFILCEKKVQYYTLLKRQYCVYIDILYIIVVLKPGI